jgi:hypothetical protein
MPTIANLPHADIQVQFPSGEVKTVNMLRMLVQTQNAEFKVEHGMFLPGVNKLRPTIKALRDFYELDWFFDAPVKTWSDCAKVMRFLHTEFSNSIKEARANND